MDSIEDEKKLLLKLTQLKSVIGNDKNIDKRVVEVTLQELDLNSKILIKKNEDNAVLGDVLLHLAYEKKNMDVFTSLICRGANFNAKDETGSTVLHKIFQTCVTLNESTNYSNKKHLTDLFNTGMWFMDSILSAHVKQKISDNPSVPNGLTHFHIACTSENIEAVELFLSNGVPVDQAVISSRFEKYTPLHFATRYHSINAVIMLLKYGANINLKNFRGMTPLHMCVEMNIAYIDFPKCSQELIDKCKALIKLILKHNVVDQEFPHLFVASAIQDSHLIETLVSQGTDVNQFRSVLAQNFEISLSPVLWKYLCEAGNFLVQGIDVHKFMSMKSQVWTGYTSLHFAVHVNVDTAKLLMKNGANIEAKDASGVTPFEMCIERYNMEDLVKIIQLIPTWKDIVISLV